MRRVYIGCHCEEGGCEAPFKGMNKGRLRRVSDNRGPLVSVNKSGQVQGWSRLYCTLSTNEKFNWIISTDNNSDGITSHELLSPNPKTTSIIKSNVI